MTLTGLLVFAGVYAVAVATPGPGIALIVARAMARGRANLAPFIAGFVLGDVVLFLLAASGLALVAHTFEYGFALIRYAGAAYLCVMAWKIWTAEPVVAEAAAGEMRERPAGAFLSSFLLTLGNPKPILFFMSIMPLVVDMRTLDLARALQVMVVIVLVIAPILTGFALAADGARRVFRSPLAIRRINRTTAGVMAGAALAMAAR